MTGSKDDFDDAALAALFASAQDDAPAPSADLLARITQDAAQVQPQPAPVDAPTPEGLFSQMLSAIGGWPTLGGLATATVAGVYIGMAQPDLVGVTTADLEGEDYVTTEIWPSDDLFFEEG